MQRAASIIVLGLLCFPAAIVTAMARITADTAPPAILRLAQGYADELAQRGRLSGRVRIEAGRDLGSAGRADHDFVADECVVRIDPRAALAQYADAASLRFLVYHELAHCEFYRRPGGLFSQAALSPVQARLIDDLVLLDALDADEPEDRLNLYPLAHETYADLRAAALLLEEGVGEDAVRRIATMRSEAAFDRYHATAPALTRLLAMPAPARTGARLESAVRTLTGEHLLLVAIGPALRPTAGFPLAFWQLVESRVGSVQGRLASGQDRWMAYLGNVDAPRAHLEAHPHLAWAFMHRDRAVADQRQTFIDAWLHGVYGDLPVREEAAALESAIADVVDRLRDSPRS